MGRGAVSISGPLIGLGWFSLDGEEGEVLYLRVLASPPALLVFLLMPRVPAQAALLFAGCQHLETGDQSDCHVSERGRAGFPQGACQAEI